MDNSRRSFMQKSVAAGLGLAALHLPFEALSANQFGSPHLDQKL
jgi:hypothetical protein